MIFFFLTFQAEVLKKEVKTEEASRGRYAFQALKGISFFISVVHGMYIQGGAGSEPSLLTKLDENGAVSPIPSGPCHSFQASLCFVSVLCGAAMVVISLKPGPGQNQVEILFSV